MSRPLTLVLGASANPERVSYRALNQLHAHGQEIFAVGKRLGQVGSVAIHTDLDGLNLPVDTVSMYLNAQNQSDWAERILALKPRRIIFNPGSENPDLENAAKEAGIQTERACTLVLLATSRY